MIKEKWKRTTLTLFYFSLFLIHSVSLSISLSHFLFPSFTLPSYPFISLLHSPLFSISSLLRMSTPSISFLLHFTCLPARPSVRLFVCLSVYLSVLPFYRNVLDLLSLSLKIFDRDITVFRNLRSVNSTFWRLSNNSNFLLFPRVVKYNTFLNKSNI